MKCRMASRLASFLGVPGVPGVPPLKINGNSWNTAISVRCSGCTNLADGKPKQRREKSNDGELSFALASFLNVS